MELTREEIKDLRFRMRDVLLAHDVRGFRALLEGDGRYLVEADGITRERLVAMDDDRISLLMHEMKARQMYLGEAWQASRNHLRRLALLDALKLDDTPGNPALSAHLSANAGRLPPCARCQYFRTPPADGEQPCMLLGATPADVACAGWTPANS